MYVGGYISRLAFVSVPLARGRLDKLLLVLGNM